MDLDGVVSSVEPLELKEGEKIGLGGLRVETAQPLPIQPPSFVKEPPTQALSKAPETSPIVDESLLNANKNDLYKRNIK